MGGENADAPSKYYRDREGCEANTRQVLSVLDAMDAALKNVSDTNDQRALETLHQQINTYNNKYSTMVRCLDEYPGALRRVIDFQETLLAETNDQFIVGDQLRHVTFDYDSEVVYLLQDEAKLKTLLYKYSRGLISKYKYLETFSTSAVGDQNVLASLSSLVGKIRRSLLDPLKERLTLIQRTLTSGYADALLRAMEFETYLEPLAFYNTAKVRTRSPTS